MRTRTGVVVAATLATALVFAACSGDTSQQTPTAQEREDEDQETVAPSPEEEAPSAEEDRDTSFTTTFEPSGASRGSWDVVALGDSTTSGWNVRPDEDFSPDAAYPGIYAQLLADEQHVDVTLHSYYPAQLGNEVRTVAGWNQVLAKDRAIRKALAEAEVVVVWIGFHNVVPALVFGECPAPSEWPAYGDCLKSMTRTMPRDYERLFATIRGLVPEGATVLAGNLAMPPWLSEGWSDDRRWPRIRSVAIDDWIGALEAAAKAHGGLIVDTYVALPKYEGILGDDDLHFNAKGHRLLAELHLAQDGIEPPK